MTHKKIKLSDVIAGFISTFIIGINSIFINVFIAKFYNNQVLGGFNQVYAIFLFAAQFASFGVHLSSLKFISQFHNHVKCKVKNIVSSACYVTIIFSSFSVLVLILLKPLIFLLFKSHYVSDGIPFILGALIFFPLNKVFLSYYNGIKRIKEYSIFSALRFIFMFICIIFFPLSNISGKYLPYTITISEILTFIVIFIYSRQIFHLKFSKQISYWGRKNFIYGSKVVGGSFFLAMNTRVDIVMLGVFYSDYIVGIYSIGAMLAEAFSQVGIILRTNINPLLTQLNYQNKMELEKMINLYKRKFYLYIVPSGILLITTAIICFNFFKINPEYYQSLIVFIIITSGIIAVSGYLPFQMIFTQTGYPALQTTFIISVSLTNFLFNLTLIPFLGLYGAALGTCIAYISQMFLMKYLTLKTIKIKI